MPMQATERLNKLERSALALLVLVVLGFCVLVEIRSAFLTRRMGDLGCYLRGAWAVRAGEDMYGVTDDNKWHYNYPPFLAIVLTPLADPPRGYDTTGYVPYGLSAAIFMVLNIAFLIYAVHTLASALESSSADDSFRTQPRYCRRWWTLRLWPVLVCLPPLAQTVNRGQVNHIVIALLCAFMAGLLRGQRLRAGVFLALAISIKIIPAYLLVYPVWKRDRRTLAGCALGLFLALVAVPVLALGPQRTVDQYERYATVLFGPLFQVTDDTTRQDELLGMNATDSMGLKHAMHNWMYYDLRWQRPKEYHPAVVWTYRIAGVLMTFLTLWPGTLHSVRRPWRDLQQFSALIVLMVVFAPVSHLHYYAFCLPLVMCLFAARWEGRADVSPGWGLGLLCAWWFAANLLPSVPDWDRLKDLCLALFGTLPVWVVAVVQLWRHPAVPAAGAVEPVDVPRLAA